MDLRDEKANLDRRESGVHRATPKKAFKDRRVPSDLAVIKVGTDATDNRACPACLDPKATRAARATSAVPESKAKRAIEATTANRELRVNVVSKVRWDRVVNRATMVCQGRREDQGLWGHRGCRDAMARKARKANQHTWRRRSAHLDYQDPKATAACRDFQARKEMRDSAECRANQDLRDSKATRANSAYQVSQDGRAKTACRAFRAQKAIRALVSRASLACQAPKATAASTDRKDKKAIKENRAPRPIKRPSKKASQADRVIREKRATKAIWDWPACPANQAPLAFPAYPV